MQFSLQRQEGPGGDSLSNTLSVGQNDDVFTKCSPSPDNALFNFYYEIKYITHLRLNKALEQNCFWIHLVRTPSEPKFDLEPSVIDHLR